MRSNQLRIQPLGDDEYPDEHRTIALRHVTKEQSENNLTRAFARAPEVLDAFLSWAINIMTRTTLPDREREIVTVPGRVSGQVKL